jgi:hypothetical protein
MLDRIGWVACSALHEHVADLHPDRHAMVTEQIRELIGK